MGRRIAGTAFVKVDGAQFALKGSMVVSQTRFERTGIAGQDGVHGFSEMPRVPFIEGVFSLVPELSLEGLQTITNATVTAELANGRAYVLRNAWTAGTYDARTAEGEVTIRFEGEDMFEL